MAVYSGIYYWCLADTLKTLGVWAVSRLVSAGVYAIQGFCGLVSVVSGVQCPLKKGVFEARHQTPKAVKFD